MRLLLDNCVHFGAEVLFPGHEVLHACDLGWRELSNRELIARTAQQFDVLVTTDKHTDTSIISTGCPYRSLN